jgi:hypothetical protein
MAYGRPGFLLCAMVIRRRQTASSRTMASKRRCRMANRYETDRESGIRDSGAYPVLGITSAAARQFIAHIRPVSYRSIMFAALASVALLVGCAVAVWLLRSLWNYFLTPMGKFWRLTGKHPELALALFAEEPDVLIQPQGTVPKSHWGTSVKWKACSKGEHKLCKTPAN